MGKPLISQKRGKGSPSYRSPGHRFKGATGIEEKNSYKIVGLIKDPAHTAPLARVVYDDNTKGLIVAPEGIRVGETFSIGSGDVKIGNVLKLNDIPLGTKIFNIESVPGDKGKFVRTSGTTARVVDRVKDKIKVMLPSKRSKYFHPSCRAMIGVVAGSGRLEKPLMKAGNLHKKMRARNKLYPKVSGVAMNSLSHPFGGTKSSHKGRPTIAPKNAPPGRKVGKIRPRQTGRTKGKRIKRRE